LELVKNVKGQLWDSTAVCVVVLHNISVILTFDFVIHLLSISINSTYFSTVVIMLHDFADFFMQYMTVFVLFGW